MKYQSNLKQVFADVQRRIDRGVKFLDKAVGRKKWVKKIDPRMLDMQSTNKCICGFVFGDYNDLISGDIKNVPVHVRKNPAAYGFRITDSMSLDYNITDDQQWDILGHLWIDTINSFKK